MDVASIGVDEAAARAYFERFRPSQEKTAAEVKTNDSLVPGEISKISDAWNTEDAVAKHAAMRLIRRPGRLMGKHEMDGKGEVPQTVPEGVLEEDYTQGAIERLVKQAEARKAQVTIRTGREAFGRLPDCPDMRERILEGESVQGAIERLLLNAEHEEKKAGFGATDTMIAGMAGREGKDNTGPFGPAGSAVDYIGRGLMGTGLGRTAGFLLKGRGLPEAIERRLGLAGAVGGIGLAAMAHREQKMLAKEREELARQVSIQQLREYARAAQEERLHRLRSEYSKSRVKDSSEI